MKKNYFAIYKKLAFKTLLVLILFNYSVFAQTDCASALPVTINGSCITSASVSDGTQSTPTIGTCATGTFRYERWYSFTVTSGPQDIVITASTANRNLFLQLISQSGSCSGLTQIACANADSGTNSAQTETISYAALANGTYYIKVVNVGNNNTMTLNSLCVTSPPANDTCSGAQTITSGTSCATTTGSTLGASDNNETGDCTSGTENAVWYQFQAVASTHTITVDGVAGFDAVLNVISACGSATAPTGASCMDDTDDGGIETLTVTGLTIGAFYKIQVHDWWGVQMSNGFTICVTHAPPPTITNLLTPSSGCEGSNITITGTNLTGATAATVTIGGTAVSSITSNNGSTIVAVIGAGTTGTVSVTTPDGTATSIGTFTVNPLPAVIAGGATTVCVGGSTPAFTNATPGGTWSITNGTGSASITSGGIVTGSSAGTVTVNYTLPTTCTRTVSLTVNQLPAAIAGGSPTVCEGASTPAFTNTVSGGTWSVTNGTGSATITAGGILTGSTAGTVTVNYSTGSCTPVTYGVTVNPAPAAPTAPVNSSITGTGFTVTWTASAGAVNYVLEVYTNAARTTPAPGSPFTIASPTVSYAVTGLNPGTTYYYQIKATGALCSSSYVLGSVTTLVAIPSNNQCANAISIPCGTTNLAGTTVNAASYTHGTGCSMSNYGVWYTFTGDGTQNVISVTTTSFDVEMAIASGSCGSLTNIACRDVALSSGTETYTINTVSGTTYYVYIADYLTGGSLTGTFTISRTCIAPLTNDECSNAISLTVSSTCNYTTYTNSGATASTGMTAPGCASYSGGDVWFSVVVPATGEINVDLQAGSMTDSGIAFYSGSCGALTLLDCDDDSSTNGLMSFLSRTGLTPGQTIYIRVWEYGNDNNGTFGICVSTPSCPSPADLFANILSTTSVTVNWTASAPPASGGYQYYINTTGVAPTNATPPTGSTAAGVIGVTLTGLTPGQKYYFWVRSYCGGSDTSTWFGATNYTPCNVGSGSGTTTNACPSVIAGGLGLSGGNPAALSCTALGCIDLEATYLQLNQPTNYSVAPITYAPPYQFTCLQNPVSVNVDDIWSPTINLPFNFCFYGNNYNKCLIGSNGVITFDTTTYAPGGYNAWSFTNSLPNASLFRNTIFGVYHDIDPSKGGQVGWELITLNTGCRALVASWNDIPMYSTACNSSLYTGMIVLYENTNVIEVYVKEKNICPSWNDGNAIIGLQNSAGTAAVVAPNRNGLDTNWTVTSEAWRFTPTGSSLTTIKWFEGNGTGGTQLGTTATLNVCPTTTTTYTAEVTYALCNGTNLQYTDNVVVTVDGNKIWDGSTDNNWNVADNWTPSGVPTSANCVVIPVTANNPVISGAPDGVGYNLSVYNGAQLTVNSNNNLIITDKVTVQPTGIFTLNNSASLIQINNILNSGNIIYKREAPSVRSLDYVYWSSPVAGFNVSNIVSPYSFGAVYKWNTTIANSNGGQGNWQSAAGDTMIAGKGYIARTPGTAPFNNSTTNILSGSFTGVPNNGNITIAIERGTDQNTALHYGTNGAQITNFSDNWNLLGNPYPSAIRGSQFLFDNNTKIEGNIRLWTHGTLPSNIQASPFYGSYLSNYTPGDYMTYNFTGTSCCPAAASDLFIGAGQGFFVQMVDGPAVAAAANVTVAFNNNLRSATYNNSTFYRTQNITTSSATDITNIERNRIWLDLINPNSQTDRILFGYIENATMGRDSFYDCVTQNTGGTLLYSLVDDTKFNIQGRSLPFDVNDEVPIGLNAPVEGEYTIGIAAVDGLFNQQNIYLKDNLLNITHDLKSDPYRFTTASGMFNDRFKIVYVDNALGVPTHEFDENSIKVITTGEVAVSSASLEMESIVVYNLLGQKLDTYANMHSDYVILSNLHKNNATLLLKIKLSTGETVTKKILF
jgi:hypothetical protein